MALDCSPESFSPQMNLCSFGSNLISKLYAFQFQRKRILKIGFFVPMFQLVTPGVGPIFTPGASSKQTWLRSNRRCYIPNIKALVHTVWDKKIFKNILLYLFVQSENPQQGHNLKYFGRWPLDDATCQI